MFCARGCTARVVSLPLPLTLATIGAAIFSALALLTYSRQAEAGQGLSPYSPEYEPSADDLNSIAGQVDDDPAPAALPEPSFLESIGLFSMPATRGERNNNPGNLRLSAIPWQGKIEGVDASFETFASAAAGLRALAVNLRTYQTKYDLRTVRQIIARYAPPNENNTDAYTRAVAAAVGTTADAVIDLSNDATLAALVAAIIKHENGRNIYSLADIAAAVAAA